jgi:hypothetical protein
MSKHVDVAKLARIALCFAGILLILSGIGAGLRHLEDHVIFEGTPILPKTVLYAIWALFLCPLAFAEVFFGLLCIRYNRRVVCFFEKYSRKPDRCGKSRWKRSEKHAFLGVAFGAASFYWGITDLLSSTVWVLPVFMTRHHSFGEASAGYVILILTFGLGVILGLLVPGLLLMLFARRWTVWVDRTFLLR